MVSPNREVLLIDENDDIAEALGFWLKRAGFGFRRARDVVHGLELARELPAADSIVLLDFVLPRSSAHFVREVRTAPAMRELPILLLTAYPAFLVPKLDVERVMEKPVPLDELEAALHREVRQPRAARAPIASA